MNRFQGKQPQRSRAGLRRVATLSLIVWLSPIACKSKAGSSETSATAPSPVVEAKPKSFPTAPLGAGAEVFDFTALAHTGQSIRLSDYSRKPVVVYFCPQDAQPMCTALAASIRDLWADLHSQVDMVYGVSPEPTIVHREFAADNHLSHLMLSDSDGTLHRVFGIQPGAVVGYLVGVDRKVLQVFAPPNAAAFGSEVLSAIVAKGLKRPEFPI